MVKLVIDSAKRDNPSVEGPEDYFITVFSPVKNIVSIGLEAALVPKSNYPVLGGFNSILDFTDGGGASQAQLPLQNYSGAQLATALEDALNLAGAQVYTVSYDEQTNKLTASAGIAFVIGPQTTEPAVEELLGFTGTTASAGSHTSDCFVNTSYPNHLFLDVDLGTSQGFAEGVWDTENAYTFVVPFGGANFNEFEYYTKNSVFQQVDATSDLTAHKIRIRWRSSDPLAQTLPPNLGWGFNCVDHTLVFDVQQAF